MSEILTPPGEHEQRLTFSIDVFVPNHPDRSASPTFQRTHKKLIGNNPEAKCYIDNEDCDHDHPLELHHKYVEWCDALAVDWEKIKALCPTFDWTAFDPQEPETFIDSEHNACLVLCKKHHTGKNHGIHLMPKPVWNLQKFKRRDFIMTPDEVKQQSSTATIAPPM